MSRSFRTRKTRVNLPESLIRQLHMYSLAAGAAGVGALALVQPLEAKIIYTRTHQVIRQNGAYSLDLNHDGIIDFLIQEWDNGGFSSSNALLADAAFGNAVQGKKVQFRYLASALQRGASIGPKRRFITGGSNGEVMVSVSHSTTGGTSHINGFWANGSNRYLGLKFKVGGKTHYGWARVKIQLQQFHITGTLTAYAYETVPNKAIHAGQSTSETEAVKVRLDSVNPPDSVSALPTIRIPGGLQGISLGTLALGSAGIPQGRRP
jgi:hypothetical protein